MRNLITKIAASLVTVLVSVSFVLAGSAVAGQEIKKVEVVKPEVIKVVKPEVVKVDKPEVVKAEKAKSSTSSSKVFVRPFFRPFLFNDFDFD